MILSPLGPDFYARSSDQVARALLGMRLVRRLDGELLSGLICETEAYRGEEDQACHARVGRTQRNAPLYGPPGRAYIYFTYGLHWLLNAVCEQEGFPSAVLIRAVRPTAGLERIAANRPGVKPTLWTDGPAKLCKALGIDGRLNLHDLSDPSGELWIEPGPGAPEDEVIRGPRVGIDYAAEPWLSIPWRFRIRPDGERAR